MRVYDKRLCSCLEGRRRVPDLPCSNFQRPLLPHSVALLGESGIGKLLIASQVALSFQLPFAIWPLIRLTSDRDVMGRYANGLLTKAVAWALFALISAANIWLAGRLVGSSG